MIVCILLRANAAVVHVRSYACFETLSAERATAIMAAMAAMTAAATPCRLQIAHATPSHALPPTSTSLHATAPRGPPCAAHPVQPQFHSASPARKEKHHTTSHY